MNSPTGWLCLFIPFGILYMYVFMCVCVCICMCIPPFYKMERSPLNPPSPGPSDDPLAWLTTSGMPTDSADGVGSSKTPTPNPLLTDSASSNGPRKTNSSTFTTLSPYGPLCGKKTVSRNRFEYEIVPGNFVHSSFDKYLTVNIESPICDIFETHREIVKVCGREPKISPLGNNKVIVECASPEESDRLKNLTHLAGIKAQCSPYDSMNHTKGIIFAPQLMVYSEEKLKEELEDQGVIKVERIKKKINGALVPLPNLIITFNSTRLPQEIKAAWYRFKIRQYIPRPRRCFHCQEYGHVINLCRRKNQGQPAICVNCGEIEHGECSRPSKCVHCGEGHSSLSQNCDMYIFEREVQAMRITQKITFSEAKHRVLENFIRHGVSFSSIVAKNKKRKSSRQGTVFGGASAGASTASEIIPVAQNILASSEPVPVVTGSTASSEAAPAVAGSSASSEAAPAVAGSPVSSEAAPAVAGSSASLEAEPAVAGSSASLEAEPAVAGSSASSEAKPAVAGSSASSEAEPAVAGSSASSEAAPGLAGAIVSTEATPVVSGVSEGSSRDSGGGDSMELSPLPPISSKRKATVGSSQPPDSKRQGVQKGKILKRAPKGKSTSHK